MGADEISVIIESLYAGTLEPAAWALAMNGMADLVSGSAALIFSFNPSSGAVLRDENCGFDPAAVSEYRRCWAARDPRLPAALDAPVGQPLFETRLMSKRSWQSTEIYNDFLVPIDAPWFYSTWLHKSPEKVVSLSIQGSRCRGPFDSRDSERIAPVLPHLRRALEIKDRIEFSQVRAQTLAKSMENVNFGVIVLDSGGRILEASAVAQELLRTKNGIQRNPDGTLWLREPAGTQLERWRVTGIPPVNNLDGLLHVPRLLARPLSVLVTRLPESEILWIGEEAPGWLVLLFDPDRRLSVSAEIVARDLDISAREAEIAALLAAGYELKNIAARLRISIHTVRTHLKSIYSRTCIRSQGELIQRIVNGPASCRGSASNRNVGQSTC